MSRLGNILINEKTKISLNIATFILVAGFIISVVFYGTTWIAQTENKINKNSEKIAKEVEDRKSADEAILEEVNINSAVLMDNRIILTEIQRDIQWLRAYMEDE
jgi:cell division protein FtsL